MRLRKTKVAINCFVLKIRSWKGVVWFIGDWILVFNLFSFAKNKNKKGGEEEI